VIVVEEAMVPSAEPEAVPISVPAAATVAPAATPTLVSVPAAATVPSAVPAGGGSTAPGYPAGALALIALGAITAAATGARALKKN
jgi:hypothetical protein